MNQDELINLVNQLKRPRNYSTDEALEMGAKLLATNSGMVRNDHYNTVIVALIDKIEELEKEIGSLKRGVQ